MADANDWVRHRLSEWAAWAMSSGMTIGYPSKCPFAVDRIQSDYGFIEVSPEIEQTDLAIAQMGLERPQYVKLIRSAYCGNKGYAELSRIYRRSEGAVKAMLWAAESSVGRHILLLERKAV